MAIKRLPEVRSLWEILPKGTEGGKEFARIIDLLRFHEGRRTGKQVTIFSDVAGDYHGLDGLEESASARRCQSVGSGSLRDGRGKPSATARGIDSRVHVLSHSNCTMHPGDISYGDTSRVAELREMIKSPEPAYQSIFREAYWID